MSRQSPENASNSGRVRAWHPLGRSVCSSLISLTLAACAASPADKAVVGHPTPVTTPHFSTKFNPHWRSGKHRCETGLTVISPLRAYYTVTAAPRGSTFVVRPLSHLSGKAPPAPVLLHALSSKLDYRYTFRGLGSPAQVAISVQAPNQPPEHFDVTVQQSAPISGHACSPLL